MTRAAAPALRGSIMTEINLRPDCGRCAALCCVALAFDRGVLFAFDKPAGAACGHLTEAGRCAIHTARARRGFAGCVGYDCLGAGQRVTQDLFDGRSWRGEPGLLGPMSEAFAVVRRAHELLVLLRQARRLPLSPDEGCRLTELEASLVAAKASAGAVGGLEADVRQFLHGLRRLVGS